MNTVLWLLAGGAVAWIAFSALHVNLARGLVMTLVIGSMSAYFGGSIIAPLFRRGVLAAGELDMLALLIAGTTAATFVFVSDRVYERYGV